MSKVFLDTNILVYCLDKHDPERQEKSRHLVKTLSQESVGVISTQVMQEFYVVATKKLRVDPLLAKDMLNSFEHFEVVSIMPSHIKDAIDCSIINRLSFWNALIVTAAESARCEKVWSEDLNNGQTIRGVKVQNPLV